MKKKWKPQIIRKKNNKLPVNIHEFFHTILTSIENDEKDQNVNDWKKLNGLKNQLTIKSDTSKNTIQIPPEIELGSVYFKVNRLKSKNFIKNLRHAYAHNYIEVEEVDIIKISLPSKNHQNIKLACYISFDDLKLIVSTLQKLY